MFVHRLPATEGRGTSHACRKRLEGLEARSRGGDVRSAEGPRPLHILRPLTVRQSKTLLVPIPHQVWLIPALKTLLVGANNLIISDTVHKKKKESSSTKLGTKQNWHGTLSSRRCSELGQSGFPALPFVSAVSCKVLHRPQHSKNAYPASVRRLSPLFFVLVRCPRCWNHWPASSDV